MTAPAWLARPRIAAAALGIGAQLLFSLRLTTPSKFMLDEYQYVPAARMLLALAQPVNTEHPLVGKEMIALGMALFGDNPLGWRALSTVAGTATVVGLFAIMQVIYGRLRVSVTAALLAMVNFSLFIQARIGMLDVFEMAFLTLSIAAFAAGCSAPRRRVLPLWIGGSVLLGLAIGAKWAALPFLGYVALVFLVVRWREATRAGHPPAAMLEVAEGPCWTGLDASTALAWLIGGAALVYLATFLPAFFYAKDPLTLSALLPLQEQMYAMQTQPGAHHPYSAPWYTWPFDIRPIWYYFEPSDGAAYRGVVMLGNPLIWWGGLVAAAALVWRWAMGGPARPLISVGLWLGAYLPFALIPKSIGFMFYYFPASVFLCGVIATALSTPPRRPRFWRRDTVFIAASTLLFLYFYPILAATALSDAGATRQWVWFSSWM